MKKIGNFEIYDEMKGLAIEDIRKIMGNLQAGTRIVRFSLDIVGSAGIIATLSCDLSSEIEREK